MSWVYCVESYTESVWKDQSEDALLKMEQSKPEKHRISHLNNTYTILQESEFISEGITQQSCDMLLIFCYREFQQKNRIISGFHITLGRRNGFTCGKRKEERFWILFLYLVQQNHSREKKSKQTCQRCLGIESISEEKPNFDILIIYFNIHLWYSSIHLALRLELRMRIKSDENFQTYPSPKYLGNTYLQYKAIHFEIQRKFFRNILSPTSDLLLAVII